MPVNSWREEMFEEAAAARSRAIFTIAAGESIWEAIIGCCCCCCCCCCEEVAEEEAPEKLTGAAGGGGAKASWTREPIMSERHRSRTDGASACEAVNDCSVWMTKKRRRSLRPWSTAEDSDCEDAVGKICWSASRWTTEIL